MAHSHGGGWRFPARAWHISFSPGRAVFGYGSGQPEQ